jgi:hypothetical protein
MLRINVNLYPKDGYFFKDQDHTTLRGANWSEVVRKVVEYRKRAGLPPGKPAEEVMAQACQRNPSYCHETNRVVPPPRVTAKALALQWLFGISKTPKAELEFVTPDEAKSRAGICATCPKNSSLGVSACSSCKQAFSEYRKNILGDSRIRDGRLGGCAVLGADLTTATHLDEVRIDNGDLPQNCWRKKVL